MTYISLCDAIESVQVAILSTALQSKPSHVNTVCTSIMLPDVGGQGGVESRLQEIALSTHSVQTVIVCSITQVGSGALQRSRTAYVVAAAELGPGRLCILWAGPKYGPRQH